MKSTTSESSQNVTQSTVTPFRVAQEPDTQTAPEVKKDTTSTQLGTADGLFIGYEMDNGVPYMVDYLGIRDTYKQDPEAYSEVEAIGEYLNNLVTTGQIDNSTNAVKEKLKQLEKLSGVDKTERVTMRLTRLAEYANFENKVNEAKRSSSKWSR